ncbi:hypothetical protein NC653_002760 [Populus alba x Populus x berolinensis]|uniref:Uncharacterized protein n=1 Tax=Populus alba x Populus x berolinensis TaxID=444605 RepID=A0AAD6RPT2_9ROSI|nr:hypothetical protein NC653_002760 [Populus alba x Populus x berolinensis]
MEASFGDITREEKRSERLGRKEDREQLRLSEENARHQRMRFRFDFLQQHCQVLIGRTYDQER